MSETKQELELEVTPLERPQEEWVGRLQYEKSFLAKLALADDNVRNYYAILATRYLSYDKVKSRTGWAGVSFSHRRNKLAMITINGKTLCLYLAIDPATITEGKFRTKDTSVLKKYEDTPVLLKIKSGGALRYALKLIEEQTRKQDIEYKKNLPAPITAKSLPKDTFDNLVASGMIRMIRGRSPHTASCVAAEEGDSSSDGDADGERGVNDKLNRNVANQSAGESAAASDEETASAPEYTPEAVSEAEAIAEESTTEAAEETAKREESAAEAGGGIAPSVFPYKEILELLLGGETAIRATKKYVIRSVDEMWVKAAEECLPALDTLTRNPTGFIAETEEILPIEMTKKITGRSIQHLGRHADYLSETDDGELMPTKMLNIFREDSLQTYENKFLNTLLSRLYIFMHRRAEAARKRRAEEEVYSLDLADTFRDGDLRCKMSLNIEISRKCSENAARKAEIEASLEERIEKLDAVFSAYMTSPFVQKMGASYIHPPISRTNAILKNKYFRQCLALWEFIESYDDSEHGVFFAAEEKELSDECLKETYESAARQYVAFKNAMAQAFEETEETEEETDSFAEETAVSEGVETAAGETEESGETESEEAGEEEIRGGKRYRKTFLANLILSDEQTKENFAAIANAFLKYYRVKMRIGKYGCVFSRGRERLARAEVRGKTVKLYLALNAGEEEEKYRLRDVSAIKKNEKTPALLRVRSSRSVKYAEILADRIAEKRGIPLAKKPTAIVSAADYPYRTREELIEEGLILVSGEGEPVSFSVHAFAGRIGERISQNLRELEKHFSDVPVKGMKNGEEEAEKSIEEAAKEVRAAEEFRAAEAETEDEAAIAREAEEIKLDEEKKREEEEARQKDFPQIRFRVSNDYSNPAQAGLDDTKSFLKDEAAQAAEAKAAEEKKTESFGGFFRRLFFSRKKRAEREKKAKKGKRK